MSEERVTRQVIDGHSHIGEMAPWQFYDLKEPVKPTVYEFATSADYLGHMDGLGVERALVLPNYGIPVQEQPFSLNPLVLDALSSSDRLRGGLWVSFLPQNKEMTLEALTHAGEAGVVALKTTFLLGGNPNPEEWDDETAEVAEEINRNRQGFVSTARIRRRQQAASRREEELADGHAEMRWAGYVRTSARGPEELERAESEVEHAAQLARLGLQRLYGEQDIAFSFPLPLCRGLR